MGLSFHYSGRLREAALLPAMVEEVKDLSSIYDWNYHIFEETFPEDSFGKTKYNQKIYGISFTPPECETVWLCFLSNGQMSSPVHLQFYGNSKKTDSQEYLYKLSVKTQSAGIDIHMTLIHLLKYLSKKYFLDFEAQDEGGYWETGDPEILKDAFNRYTDLLNRFSYSIEQYRLLPGEDLEGYFERLLKKIHEKYKK